MAERRTYGGGAALRIRSPRDDGGPCFSSTEAPAGICQGVHGSRSAVCDGRRYQNSPDGRLRRANHRSATRQAGEFTDPDYSERVNSAASSCFLKALAWVGLRKQGLSVPSPMRRRMMVDLENSR